jgi:hypothetical protein
MQELVTLQLEHRMQTVSKMVVLGNGRKVEHKGISLHFFPYTIIKLAAYSYLYSILTSYQG